MLKQLAKKIKKKIKKKRKVRIIQPIDPALTPTSPAGDQEKIEKMILPNGVEIEYKKILEIGDNYVKFIDKDDRLRIEKWSPTDIISGGGKEKSESDNPLVY